MPWPLARPISRARTTTKPDLPAALSPQLALGRGGQPRRLRIDLAYDGRGFHGFARQREQRTVQGVVEAALTRLLGTPITTIGSGRTDAGVHAKQQTMHGDVPADARRLADLDRLRAALDALCGAEIAILAVRVVPRTFNARFSARQRRYRYQICDAPAMQPLWRHDTWHLGPPRLDVAAMQRAGTELVGEHDFSSFCRRRGDQHLVRRIDGLRVRRDRRDLVTIAVHGPAFCHQMVRSLTGALVWVGTGRRSPGWMSEALAARDRHAVGLIAPPHGLTLTGVSF